MRKSMAVVNEPDNQFDVAAWRNRIRQAGLRCTQARIAILQRLQAASGPLTHSQVVDNLKSCSFDRATIYRSLIELAEVGLLSRMELGDHVWRFECAESAIPSMPTICILSAWFAGISNACRARPLRPLAPAIKGLAKGMISEVLLKGHCWRCV